MKNFIFLFALLLSLQASAQTGKDSVCIIRVVMPYADSSTQLYLFYQTDGIKYIDSATGGVHTLKAKVSKPIFASMVADRQHLGWQGYIKKKSNEVDFIRLYIYPGVVELKTIGLLADATFPTKGINADNQQLESDIKGAQDRGPIQLKFIRDHPNSFISLVALKEYGDRYPDTKTLAALYDGLDPNVRNTALGKEFYTYLNAGKTLAIGNPAPNFTQDDTSGCPISLSSFKGKYVLIDFWASWCGPCREDNPKLLQIYAEFKDRNFTILGVSFDEEEGKAAWLKAIVDDHLQWTQVSDLKHWDNDVGKLYSVRRIPQSYLVDPNGIIIAKDQDPAELRNKLEQILPPK